VIKCKPKIEHENMVDNEKIKAILKLKLLV